MSISFYAQVDQLQMEIHEEHEKEASLRHKLDERKDEDPLKKKIRTLLVSTGSLYFWAFIKLREMSNIPS